MLSKRADFFLLFLFLLIFIVIGHFLDVPDEPPQACQPHVAFSVTPFGQLQATALCGDTPHGEVDFFVNGMFFQHFTISTLVEGQTLVLPLASPLPDEMESWSIEGAWSQAWPPPTLDTRPPDYVTPTPNLPPPNSTPPPIGTPLPPIE